MKTPAKPSLISGIIAGDTLSLSRAITVVESMRSEDREQVLQLVDGVYNQRKAALRIGVTGIPGVGKSTFIEKLGLEIVNSGLKLAVLAVDPSSTRSAGSILGDKTRMEDLSKHPNAFIRPSPSGGTLGGVAAKTRESMLLCEAAGFDVVLVETVGVGQSETEVINITDTFLMLAMPGTGDELQGIKRGIMETADIIVINKADGDNLNLANKAKKQLEMALHLFPEHESKWRPCVMKASALHNEGVDEVWKMIKLRQDTIERNGWLAEQRRQQQLRAFQRLSEEAFYSMALRQFGGSNALAPIQEGLEKGNTNEYGAALELLSKLN